AARGGTGGGLRRPRRGLAASRRTSASTEQQARLLPGVDLLLQPFDQRGVGGVERGGVGAAVGQHALDRLQCRELPGAADLDQEVAGADLLLEPGDERLVADVAAARHGDLAEPHPDAGEQLALLGPAVGRPGRDHLGRLGPRVEDQHADLADPGAAQRRRLGHQLADGAQVRGDVPRRGRERCGRRGRRWRMRFGQCEAPRLVLVRIPVSAFGRRGPFQFRVSGPRDRVMCGRPRRVPMKITRVAPWIVDGPPEEQRPAVPGRVNAGAHLQQYVFVQVDTDEGLTGWGEVTSYPGGLPNRAVAAYLREAEPLLVGQDPMHVEALWHRLFRAFAYV